MLGVKRDNLESVHGPMKVVLTQARGLRGREGTDGADPVGDGLHRFRFVGFLPAFRTRAAF